MNESPGSRIKAARLRLEINRAELGRRVGVSGQTVLNWEEDRVRPGGKHLDVLSEALSVSPAQLMFGERERPTPAAASPSPDQEGLERIQSILRQFRGEHIPHVERMLLDLLAMLRK